MKKVTICLIVVIFTFSLAFLGIGCKEEAAPAEEAVEETAPAEEAVEEAAPAEEKLVFAYILLGDLAQPFLAETAEGFETACNLYGVEMALSVAEYDETKMISLIDAAVAADVDGIFTFTWQDAASLTPSFQRALDKGIYVAHMSTKTQDFTEEEVPHVGFSFYSQGYTLGEYWANKLEAEGLATGHNIGTFLTLTDSPLELDRRQGYLDALTDGGIEYISSDPYPTDPDQTATMDIIKVYLLANPETNLIMGTGGTTTAACFQAVEALGFSPGEVRVGGFDLLPEAVVGVRAGYGACNQDEVFPYGFLGATILYLRIAHPPLFIGDLPIHTVMIDQDNVDVYFPEE